MTERAVEALPSPPSDADVRLCSLWGITYPALLAERATALVFRLPMPPTLTNSRAGRSRHWTSMEREKKRYWMECDGLLLIGVLPDPPLYKWTKARIQSSMVLGGAMDDSNAMARHKWVEDWLVTRGYILTDRKSCLTWAGFPEQRVTRKEQAHIVITLTRPSA